jgi:N,N-dimethylformamidase
MAADILTGYADPWSVSPGDDLRLMVNSPEPTFEVSLVRLRHGDTNPAGPGFKATKVSTSLPSTFPGRLQSTRAGSYIVVPPSAELDVTALTLEAIIYPTLPGRGDLQGIITWWDPNTGGIAVVLDPRGRLQLWVGPANDRTVLTAPRALVTAQWYRVIASYDPLRSSAVLGYRLLNRSVAVMADLWQAEASVTTRPSANGRPFLIAAGWLDGSDERALGQATFDGKISGPRVWQEALPGSWTIASGQDPEITLLAAWDFGRDFASVAIHDQGPHGLHGHAVNMPMKAVTSWDWTGDELDFKHAPEQYAAIHFHSDDLGDAEWEPDVTFSVPDDLASGVYAFRLAAGGVVDHVPFFVRPPRGQRTAEIAYLMPTFTYLAYSDERMLWADNINYADLTDRTIVPSDPDVAVREHPEWGSSIYDFHRDGTGFCFASRRRPVPNMRPDYRFWLTGAPRHFAADLYLIDWLEEMDFAYDVLTDEDLHMDGQALLSGYRCVITGSHPEYWSTAMRAGFEGYIAEGGRSMYLGGNGWYWITSFHPEAPWIIEVRRGQAGSRCWESLPGENYHATTGELGGLWRHRGKAPNTLAGIGFTAQGSGLTSPGYKRLPGSHDPRAAFIFEGVSDDVIGEFGLVMGGAAGDELDRVDSPFRAGGLGSPPHSLILATSAGKHSDYYLLVHEDILISILDIGGSVNPKVRADIVFFETAAGGAMFSVGSINWMGSLSHNGYQNNVSQITRNVLSRFLDPKPFVPPTPD